MAYPFNDEDRKLRPRLTAVEIAAIAATIADGQIKKERDSTVRQTPTVLTDIEPIGGGGVTEVTPTSIVIARNVSLTGLLKDGINVSTPPTIVIDNSGGVVLSIFGVS